MDKKGISLMLTAIVILILVLFGGTIAGYLITKGQQGVEIGEKYAEQAGIAIHALPEERYILTILGGGQGILDVKVYDPVDKNYLADFDPLNGFTVKDNGIQTAVSDVKQTPVVYFGIVADPGSPLLSAVNKSLKEFAFETTGIAMVSTDDVPADGKALLVSRDDLITPAPKGAANYWGALAAAAKSLPTVPTKRNIGPNLDALIIVSDGRCDADSLMFCKNETVVTDALNGSLGIPVYLVHSTCKFPLGTAENNVTNKMAMIFNASCYTAANVTELFTDLLTEASTITVEYEPKFVSARADVTKARNVTVQVEKLIGPLASQAKYGSKPVSIELKY